MDVTTRAAVHAALGEPSRLEIVDALATGDCTVSDLGTRTRLTSNLLAHHLDVLESAGVIERRRSEGDGRRRYVVLRRAVIAEATGRAIALPSAPLFVCTHNSARSQFAAAMWLQRTGEDAASAGTQPASGVHPLAISVASDFGIDLTAAVPRGYADIEERPGIVISVCDRARETPDPFDTEHRHWSIPDPVPSKEASAFEAAFLEIVERIDDVVAGSST